MTAATPSFLSVSAADAVARISHGSRNLAVQPAPAGRALLIDIVSEDTHA
jgi:hypothetical protein